MKKFLLAAAAASLIATPAFAAPGDKGNGYHGSPRGAVSAPQKPNKAPALNRGNPRGMIAAPKKAPPRQQYRQWRKGERFDARQARNYRQIDWRQHRGLKAPPKGYRYVQSGHDAVLVGIGTGIIAAVIASILN